MKPSVVISSKGKIKNKGNTITIQVNGKAIGEVVSFDVIPQGKIEYLVSPNEEYQNGHESKE
jgi:hypothetical protein